MTAPMAPRATMDGLIAAYQNEKCTDALLPYASAPVEHFLGLIPKQTEFVSSLEASATKNVYELELERIKYFIKEYIQTRLKKLASDLYIDHSLLSERELVYYKRHIGLLKERDIYVERQERRRSREFVGFHCLVDINSIEIDGNVLEVFRGDLFVAPLDDVMELLKRNEIVLF